MSGPTTRCPHCGHLFMTCGAYVRGIHASAWDRCVLPEGHDGDHKPGRVRYVVPVE
jgi:hypothetical protein